MNGPPLGDPEHIGTDLNVFWGEKKGNGLYKKSQTLVITRHQQSTAMVPVLFGTRDQFRRRQFFQGGVGEYSLGMIQA